MEILDRLTSHRRFEARFVYFSTFESSPFDIAFKFQRLRVTERFVLLRSPQNLWLEVKIPPFFPEELGKTFEDEGEPRLPLFFFFLKNTDLVQLRAPYTSIH